MTHFTNDDMRTFKVELSERSIGHNGRKYCLLRLWRDFFIGKEVKATHSCVSPQKSGNKNRTFIVLDCM